MRPTERALEIYKEKGIIGLFYSILKRISHFIFETNSATWYIRYLDSDDIEIKSDIPLAINYSNFNETSDWIRDQNIPWMLSENERKIAINEGHYWMCAKYNGNIIGYTKVGFGKVYVNDYKKAVKFPIDTVFIYDNYVKPEFRGKKVVPYLMNEACLFFRKKGFAKALGYVPDWNIASKKSVIRIGLKSAKKIRYIRILGVKILTANPGNL